MKTQLINFTIPIRLLETVDKLARQESKSRSELLREAARLVVKDSKQRKDDFATITSSGKRVSLSETASMTIIDQIRTNLHINK